MSRLYPEKVHRGASEAAHDRSLARGLKKQHEKGQKNRDYDRLLRSEYDLDHEKSLADAALRILQIGGEIVRRKSPRVAHMKADETFSVDADFESQSAIRDEILKRIPALYPGHTIEWVAEEAESEDKREILIQGDDQLPVVEVMVDPLDGSKCKRYGEPYSTVILRISVGDEVVLSAVMTPFEDTCTIATGDHKDGGVKQFILDNSLRPTKLVEYEEGTFAEIDTFKNGNGYVDGLYINAYNGQLKLQLQSNILERYEVINYGSHGSNGYDIDKIVNGVADFHVLDCKGGDWDVLPGADMVIKSGGKVTFIRNEAGEIELAVFTRRGVSDNLHRELFNIVKETHSNYQGFRYRPESSSVVTNDETEKEKQDRTDQALPIIHYFAQMYE